MNRLESMAEIMQYLKDQADQRSPENDEGGLLMEIRDQLAMGLIEIHGFDYFMTIGDEEVIPCEWTGTMHSPNSIRVMPVND